jgi:hypothetical protein
MDRPNLSIDRLSPPESKIALFRSLFRGRDGVHARRFDSRKTGKSGYSPACGNEWMPGVLEKPRIKCAACPHSLIEAPPAGLEPATRGLTVRCSTN